MKKLFTLLTLILSLCSGAWALDNGTFSYTVSGGEVTITGFASGFDVPENYDLVIPNEIEGKPVTKIGSDPYNFDRAFGGNIYSAGGKGDSDNARKDIGGQQPCYDRHH